MQRFSPRTSNLFIFILFATHKKRKLKKNTLNKFFFTPRIKKKTELFDLHVLKILSKGKGQLLLTLHWTSSFNNTSHQSMLLDLSNSQYHHSWDSDCQKQGNSGLGNYIGGVSGLRFIKNYSLPGQESLSSDLILKYNKLIKSIIQAQELEIQQLKDNEWSLK